MEDEAQLTQPSLFWEGQPWKSGSISPRPGSLV